MSVNEEYKERLVHALFKLMQGMKAVSEECCSACEDISEKEFNMVSIIGQRGNMKMSELAQSMSAPMSTITSMIDKLVKKKYVDRYHSGEDRRVVLVTLAAKGKETFDRFTNTKDTLSTNILSLFDDEDQVKLLDILEKIPAALTK
jgi:DNA-binding MarR family transcriptional regulator